MTCFFCRGNAEQTTTEYIEKIDNFSTFGDLQTFCLKIQFLLCCFKVTKH